jgi:hypothetical protein
LITAVAPAISAGVSPLSPRLAVDPSGRLLVAWVDGNVDNTVRSAHLARFDGTSWDTSFGTIRASADSNSRVARLDLAVTADGFPIVAWDEVSGTNQSPNTYVWKSNH